MLLKDHPECQNKIQDTCKSELFVMDSKHQDLNVYSIIPLDGKCPMCTVNWQHTYDL